MRTRAFPNSSYLFATLLLTLGLAATACQQGTGTNANGNTAATATNANLGTIVNSNAVAAVDPSAVINTREPETYKATMTLSFITEGGAKAIGIPELSMEVARKGTDRLVSFPLPNGERLTYLDRADKPTIIIPSRKQYAELTPEATGFQIQKMMSPGQIVSFLEKQKGYERVGEEQYNGRATDKYRFANTTQTNSQAGEVKSEAYVYVDKETGLPLHAELSSQAAGSMNGVKGARVLIEMKDLTTNVDPALFEIPQGYAKVSEQQVRQQLDALAGTVTAVLKALISNMNSGGGAGSGNTSSTGGSATATPAMSPSPSAQP
jgi:hypothetical protein